MGFFLTYILLPSLFASGPLCKNLFDPNEAETKFIERVEKVLEKPPFEDSIFTSTRLDQTKLNFYQSQQKHLKRLLSDGTISITDVASARPIEVKTPEGKFYDLVVYRKKILLFDKDGTEAPLEFQRKRISAFLQVKDLFYSKAPSAFFW